LKQRDAAPFQKYQSALKHQLLGRTAQLNAVLSTLEQAARTIQNDLVTVLSDKTAEGVYVAVFLPQARSNNPLSAFGKTVTVAYQPLAESAADTVISALEKEAEGALNGSEISRLVGVANVSDELRSSSVFVTHIGCRKSALDGLRSRLDSVFERVVDKWQERTVGRIFDDATPLSLSSVANTSKPGDCLPLYEFKSLNRIMTTNAPI
jgi:hypothetical protein